jgi:ankyrin repeat protein
MTLLGSSLSASCRRDDGGRTALHWAAAAGLSTVVQLLLAAGAAAQERRMQAYKTDMVALSSMGMPPFPPPPVMPRLTFFQVTLFLSLSLCMNHERTIIPLLCCVHQQLY